MRRKKEAENMVWFDTWEDMVNAVAYGGYNMTIRQVCQMLKVSRTWYTRYIAPYIRYTYISNGIKSDDIRVANYARSLRETLETIDMCRRSIGNDDYASTVLINRKSVYELIKKAQFTATRQTYHVDIDDCMTYEEHKDMSAWWEFYRQSKEKKEKCKIPRPNFALENLIRERAHVSSRSDCKPIAVDVPAFDEDNFCDVISQWHAGCDYKGYGDTDENVYRHLFGSAAIRIVGKFEDKQGNQTEKVLYYIPNDGCNEYEYEPYLWPYGGHRLLLPYEVYLQYKERIDRNHEVLHRHTDWESVYEYDLLGRK